LVLLERPPVVSKLVIDEAQVVQGGALELAIADFAPMAMLRVRWSMAVGYSPISQ